MILACVLALLAPAVGAADPPPSPAIKETTEVLGDVPADMAGRWLVVGRIVLPSGKVRPVAHTWEIRPGEGHLELVVGRSPLPETVAGEIDAAARAGTGWEPTAADRRTIADAWGKIPPAGDHLAIETKIAAAGAFPPELGEDEVVKGAALAIVTTEAFTGHERVARTISIYGVRERTPTTLAGTFVTTSLAIAPLPIPITLKGDFRAFRVDVAPRSWLGRLFSGCRRD
jgi:hypothetical protein